MSDRERLMALELENRKLKRDVEVLEQIIAQMRLTINRLITHYVTKAGM